MVKLFPVLDILQIFEVEAEQVYIVCKLPSELAV